MCKTWIKINECNINKSLSACGFWSGINVWIERPHIINRKLLATEIIQTSVFSSSNEKPCDIDFNAEIFNEFSNDFRKECAKYLNTESGKPCEQEKHMTLKFRQLIPRNLNKFNSVLEAILLGENAATFWPKEKDVQCPTITPTFPYRIRLCTDKIVIEAYRDESKESSTIKASEEWLMSSVLPKICKWCCSSPSSPVLPSLNLISAKSYSENYHYLKEKYGKKYVEMWPECSDPLKYVYEDIAIAAYLMTLWIKEREDLNLSSKQTFVDLGCGNGLLVDILTSEGHIGLGIDIRRRKIWDLYDSHTTLVESTIEPSDYHIFPHHDWIIGNHSDELTPWIPVIAARSSYKMRMFLLPCCPYTFNGKYDRCNSGKTQYQSYLSFIHDLCEKMGFDVQEDKLRIPSTKRTCFVCTSRSYKEEDEYSIDSIRKEFINSYSRKPGKTPMLTTISDKKLDHVVNTDFQSSTLGDIIQLKEENWITDFKPREREELVQNCSKLDRNFLDETVRTVAFMLLRKENYISLPRGSETFLWNVGGKITLQDLVKCVDASILKKMKNQCGGFQTFLRNHGNVFQLKDGNVELTVPSKDKILNNDSPRKRHRRWKKVYSFQEKPCFFFFHHPQGCPLEVSDCQFSHETVEK